MKTINKSKLSGDLLSAYDKIQKLKEKDSAKGLEMEQKFISILDKKNHESIVSKPIKKSTTKKVTKNKTAKKTTGVAKRRTVMTVAKEIRKKDESWQDALKRAKLDMNKSTKKQVSAIDDELSKLKNLIKNDKNLKGFKGSDSDLIRDASRKALPKGKRISKKGGKNQHGTSKGGRVYYENRENRSDRYAPKYPKDKPYLKYGGDVMSLGIANADAVYNKGGEIDSVYVDELRFRTGMSKDAIEELIERNNFSKDNVLNLMVGLDRDFIKPSLVSSAYFGGKSSKENKKLVEFSKSNKAFKMAKGGTLESKFDGYELMYKYALANNFTPRQLAEELRFMTNLQNKGDKELYDFLNNLSNMFPDTPISEFQKGGRVPYNYENLKSGKVKPIHKLDDELIKKAKDKDDFHKMRINYYAKNGRPNLYAEGGEIDLFEDYEKQPNKLSEIVEKYEERYLDGDMGYEDTKKFLKEVNAIGYTFDYGLDNEPYNLRPMMAKGGDVMSLGISNADAVFKKGGELYTPEEAMEFANRISKKLMAKGGAISSIKKNNDLSIHDSYYAKGGLTDSQYIPSYEIYEVVTKDGKVYENDYSAMEFLSGAYVSDKVVTESDEKDKNQMTLFDKGGKIPKGAIYIKRRDIDFITVGDDEDDGKKVSGKNLFNGFWIDPKKQKTLIAEATKDGRLGKSKAKSKAKYKGGVDKEYYKYFKGYKANTTQYLLLDDSNGYLVTKYRNSDVDDSYDVYDEDYNFRGSADSISKGESGKQKIKLVKSDFTNAKSFKDLVVKKRIDFNSAMTMAKGGKTDGDTLGDFKKRLLELGDKEFVEYKEKQLKKQDLYYAFRDRLKNVHKQTIVIKDDLPFEKGGRTISIVNDGVKFDKSKYKAVYGDFDNDGTVNIDDANPLDSTKKNKVEQVELKDTFDKLLGVKAELDDIMYDAVDTLDKKAPKDSDIYARTKTPYSILKKLVEKRMLDPEKGLTDMIGTTIAVGSQKELENVRDDIDGGLLGKVLDKDDYYKSPKAGYRAYHYIVEYKGVPVEVQLKTKKMKKLNEVSHDFYKKGTLNAKGLDAVSKTFEKADRGDKKALTEVNRLLSNKKALASKISTSKMAKGGEIKENEVRLLKANIKQLGGKDDGIILKEVKPILAKYKGRKKTNNYSELEKEDLEKLLKTNIRLLGGKDSKEILRDSFYMVEQLSKKSYAKGGKTKTKKPNSFFAVVKREQKEGESWKDAIQRVKKENSKKNSK